MTSSTLGRVARLALVTGSVLAVGIAAHTAVNLRYLRRPVPGHPASPRPVTPERVSILIPARNEASTVETVLRSAADQRPDAGTTPLAVEVIVLDDGSDDGTGEIAHGVARQIAEGSAQVARMDESAPAPEIRVLRFPDASPPDGWLGKPWACARLADAATGSVLAFVDADVELGPDAMAALVDTLRGDGFAMVAPYPHQEAVTWLERLVQPLLTWSWASTMPLRWAETSARPSLSAANGQLLVVDAAAYRSVGGHAAVAGEVLEDIALMRAFKRAGLRTVTVDGSGLARCRMYTGTEQVVNGYGKSLWDAFNGPAGSIATNMFLLLTFCAPAVGVVAARSTGLRAICLVGYAGGVTSRILVARRTGERVTPDAMAHPASIVAFAILNGISWTRHLRGTNSWKGRSVVTGSTSNASVAREDAQPVQLVRSTEGEDA